ncbi:hypothetical protein [Terrisporobacter sp.]
MLLRKNKGSILIMSLIVFSIISLFCVTCSGLILSNIRISDLEYKSEKLKEKNLGAIELISSNMQKELNYAIKNTTNEDEFYNYLTKNNSNDFINKAKYIPSTTIKDTVVQMGLDEEYSTKEFLHYKILVKSKIDNHQKDVLIHAKIENPWFGVKEEAKDDQVDNEILEKGQVENLNEENIKDVSEEDVKDINEGDLISFYNYEEK